MIEVYCKPKIFNNSHDLLTNNNYGYWIDSNKNHKLKNYKPKGDTDKFQVEKDYIKNVVSTNQLNIDLNQFRLSI